MKTLEERVAALEGWKEALSLDIQDLKDRMSRLEERMDHIDKKIDEKIFVLENWIIALDKKIDERTFALDKKIDTYFRWTLGMFFMVLLGLLGVLLKAG